MRRNSEGVSWHSSDLFHAVALLFSFASLSLHGNALASRSTRAMHTTVHTMTPTASRRMVRPTALPDEHNRWCTITSAQALYILTFREQSSCCCYRFSEPLASANNATASGSYSPSGPLRPPLVMRVLIVALSEKLCGFDRVTQTALAFYNVNEKTSGSASFLVRPYLYLQWFFFSASWTASPADKPRMEVWTSASLNALFDESCGVNDVKVERSYHAAWSVCRSGETPSSVVFERLSNTSGEMYVFAQDARLSWHQFSSDGLCRNDKNYKLEIVENTRLSFLSVQFESVPANRSCRIVCLFDSCNLDPGIDLYYTGFLSLRYEMRSAVSGCNPNAYSGFSLTLNVPSQGAVTLTSYELDSPFAATATVSAANDVEEENMPDVNIRIFSAVIGGTLSLVALVSVLVLAAFVIKRAKSPKQTQRRTPRIDHQSFADVKSVAPVKAAVVSKSKLLHGTLPSGEISEMIPLRRIKAEFNDDSCSASPSADESLALNPSGDHVYCSLVSLDKNGGLNTAKNYNEPHYADLHPINDSRFYSTLSETDLLSKIPQSQ